jgi:hypothetical protein
LSVGWGIRIRVLIWCLIWILKLALLCALSMVLSLTFGCGWLSWRWLYIVSLTVQVGRVLCTLLLQTRALSHVLSKPRNKLPVLSELICESLERECRDYGRCHICTPLIKQYTNRAVWA